MSENEVVIKSGRRMAIGADWWEVRDAGQPVEFVDLITEARHINGVFYLSFASGIVDANNEGVAQVATRLRMSLASAQILHGILGDMIKGALMPPDQSKAN